MFVRTYKSMGSCLVTLPHLIIMGRIRTPGRKRKRKSPARSAKRKLQKLSKTVSTLVKVQKSDQGWQDNSTGTLATEVSTSLIQLRGYFGVARGDETLRIGNQLVARTIRVKGYIQGGSGGIAPDDHNRVRVVVAQFDGPIGIVNARAALFTSPGVDSFRAKRPGVSYRLLYDRTFSVGTIGGLRPQKAIRFTIKVPKKHNVMTFASDTAGSMITNNIYMYAVSDSGVIDHPTIWLRDRCVFDR